MLMNQSDIVDVVFCIIEDHDGLSETPIIRDLKNCTDVHDIPVTTPTGEFDWSRLSPYTWVVSIYFPNSLVLRFYSEEDHITGLKKVVLWDNDLEYIIDKYKVSYDEIQDGEFY